MIQKNTQPALKDNEPNTKVYGDNTGADNTYVWHVNDKVVSGSSPAFILDAMKEKGKKPEISRKGIVFLLHNSLVPTPETVYKNVYALGVGDQLSFNPDKPNDDPVFSCDYPYWSVHCTGKSDPSTKKLLKVLTRSVAKHVQGPSVLMLSSGKDSTSIALAIKEAGVSDQVQAYTYTDAKSGYIEEAEDAAKTAEKLGIRHQKITVPDDPKNVREALIHFFTHASYPSCDPTTIPYVVGLYHEGIRNTQIIDGTRSDMSMGMSPGAPYDKICKYYDMIGGGWTSFGKVRAKVPYHHKAVKFVSTWPEINLYRHGHFRANETRRFFDHDVDTEKFWLKVYKDHAHRPLIDQYSYTNDQYFAGCGIIPKIKMTAESLSCESVLPWADQDFINYYFNLPRAMTIAKFDKASVAMRMPRRL